MRRLWALLLLAVLASQPACIWKLWSGEKNPQEKVYDVYGTVQSINLERLVIDARRGGTRTFYFTDASTKGGDFGEGAYVHVYYKTRNERDEITLVVEKVK